MKWKGYPESDNTWELAQDIHAPDLLKRYHQCYPLQNKKAAKTKRKPSSRTQANTAWLQTLQMNLLPAPTSRLSPSTYYDLIPLTAQLLLDVAQEILQEATICHEEEPLPSSPRTGLNALCNSKCSLADTIEVTEGLAATIKNCESFHQLRILLLQEQIARLQHAATQSANDCPNNDDEHPHFMAAPVGFTINTSHLPNATLPAGRNSSQLAKWVRRLPDRRALLYTEDDGPRDQPYAIKLYAAPDLSDDTPAQSLPRWLLDALTGPSAAFHTVHAAADATLDWGLYAELLRYRELNQKAKAINDSISNLEAEVSGVLADQWLALGHLEGARATVHLGHV